MLSSLISTFKAGVAAIILTPSLFLGHQTVHTSTPIYGSISPQFVGGQTYYVAGSGVSAAATSIPLTSFTLPTSNTPIQTADIGPDLYVTLEPQSVTKKEFVDCHAVNQLPNGTAILLNCTRGLQFVSPYTASSALAVSHAGGSQAVVSDPPQLYQSILNYINDATSSGAVDASQLVKGIVELGTGQEAASTTRIGGGNTSAALALTTIISTSSRPLNGNWIPVTNSSGDLSAFISSTTISSMTLSGTTTISGKIYVGTSSIYSLNEQVFTSSGTFTVPVGVTRIKVRAVGGGGGGGNTAAAPNSAGAGGGAGAYVEGFLNVTGSSTVAVVVGTGGGTGGTTTVATFSAGGGSGGAAGGSGSAGGGGPGGSAIGGLLNIPGGQSNSGVVGSTAASAGSAGGQGGGSAFGSGAPGSACNSTTGAGGTNATVPGAGGGGSCNANNSSSQTGGTGANGIAIIEW